MAEKFRKSLTRSGKILLAGRDAESNEKLVGQAGKEEMVLHTKMPGSPFVNIKADRKEVSGEDIEDAALLCARYSQAWKKARVKKDVEVDYFLGKDILKIDGMKLGTFYVKKSKTITLKKDKIMESDSKEKEK